MGAGTDHQDDRTLADRSRRGDRGAFDEVCRRHLGVAWRLGLAVTRDAAAAGTAVASAFAGVLTRAPEPGAAPPQALLVQLAAATRLAALDASALPAGASAVSGALRLDAAQARLGFVDRAYQSLPERWRSALWLVDVEGWSVGDAAAVLDLTPLSTSALLDRARLGLREQVLLAGLRRPSPMDCRRTTDCLTGYADGTLTQAEEARVRRHLDACAECRGRLGALDDLVPVLRGAVVPVPVSLHDDAAQRWASALVRPAARLLVGLPGGRPLPAWADRAFAGAIAAVVAMGITAATMLASRDRGTTGDPRPPAVAAGGVDQSSASTGDDAGPGGGAPIITSPTSRGGAGGSGEGAQSGGGALPRNTDPLAQPAPPAQPPASNPPPGANPPPSSNPPGAAAPDDEAALAAGVGGVGGVAIGEECSGGELFGVGAGCPPPASNDPLSVGGSLLP